MLSLIKISCLVLINTFPLDCRPYYEQQELWPTVCDTFDAAFVFYGPKETPRVLFVNELGREYYKPMVCEYWYADEYHPKSWTCSWDHKICFAWKDRWNRCHRVVKVGSFYDIWFSEYRSIPVPMSALSHPMKRDVGEAIRSSIVRGVLLALQAGDPKPNLFAPLFGM